MWHPAVRCKLVATLTQPPERQQEETIRRHFDVMVEKVEASVRLVAEGHGI